MRISTLISFFVPMIMWYLYAFIDSLLIDIIIIIIGSISTGVGLSILYSLVFEEG